MTALWDINVNVPVQEQVFQRNNPTSCKVYPMKYLFCATDHIGFLLQCNIVMQITYANELMDNDKNSI